MDYKPLIAKAIERSGYSRYKLAQQLGFKRESAIYRVEAGKAGLSADKLAKLLQLAGMLTKTLAGAVILITAALPTATRDASAATETVRAALDRSIHYAKQIAAWAHGTITHATHCHAC